MKKIITTIFLTFFCLINLSTLVFAGTQKVNTSCTDNSECEDGLICQQTAGGSLCKSLIDALTSRPAVSTIINAGDPKKDDTQAIKALPDISLEGGMTLAIKAMLRSAMYLTIIAIVVAAIYYIISRGKDEDMTKAKDIILYLVIGMAIIAAAYGIVSGVAQFNVFG